MKEQKHISLSQLNQQIKQNLKMAFPEALWLMAEIGQLQENISGHCYLDLVEKDEVTHQLLARNKANIWAYTYRMLKPFFETSTRQSFTSGIKVLLKATVEYHEQYGISLNIKDIDPSYTVGELVMRRQQTIQQLQDDGVYDMNKELELPTLPQRLAIVSSATAAGYEDFLKQLNNTGRPISFTTQLFQATMQGDAAPVSIIQAMDEVYAQLDDFDAVVVIRGGGASMDLSCFDDYDLAYYVTQFPLPVITGIGHERDESVLDLVANTSLKTPTAVAAWLTDILISQLEYILDMEAQVLQSVEHTLQQGKHQLQLATQRLPLLINQYVEIKKMELTRLTEDLEKLPKQFIQKQRERVNHLEHSFSREIPLLLSSHKKKLNYLMEKAQVGSHHLLRSQRQRLQMFEQITRSVDPKNVLKKGYSITLKNGKAVTAASMLSKGDEITTRFYEGEVTSKVETKK